MTNAVSRLAGFLLCAAAIAGGCAAPRTTGDSFELPASAYGPAFDAVRDTLRTWRFNLERVDAQEGVITTQPKETAGFLSPWDREQSSVGDEVEDFLHRQSRVVRVTFDPPVTESTPPDTVVTARVHVFQLRRHQPGWQVEPTSVRLSSTWSDPALRQRRLQPAYDVPWREDPDLAARLALAISDALSSAKPEISAEK